MSVKKWSNDLGSYKDFMAKPVLLIVGVLLINSAAVVKAEVLGYFNNGAGLTGVVSGDSADLRDRKIDLYLNGIKSNTLLLERSSWKLEGDTIGPIGKVPESIPAGYMAVAAQDGIFYIPGLGRGFFVTAGYPAKIFFADKENEIKKIDLPVTGGEIRGFKIAKTGVDLLFYNRKTLTKEENGKYLVSFGRAPGENVLIKASKDKVLSFEKLNSSDPEVIWCEDGKYSKVNSKTGKIEVQ